MQKNWTKYTYLFTIAFFILGMFNIIFAWLGFICLITPFLILLKTGKNKWCQSYCPRANFYSLIFRNKSRSIPAWIKKPWVKDVVLTYFILNIFILLMSTLMVLLGRMDSYEMVRFMIAFRLPWDIPQVAQMTFLPSWMVHLSFRMYSMMFTTTIIGLILGFLYRPRTWCTICPVMTISNHYILKNISNDKELKKN